MGQEGGAARTAWKAISRARKQEQRAWQQANVLRASQMDWRAKRTLDHHSSRQGWEHRLLDDSHWQGQAPAAFRGHFPSDPAKQHSGTSPGHTCSPQQSLQATPMATIHGGRAETGYRYLAPGQSHGAGRDFPGGPSRCKQDQTSCQAPAQASRGGNATDTVTVTSHSRRHRGATTSRSRDTATWPLQQQHNPGVYANPRPRARCRQPQPNNHRTQGQTLTTHLLGQRHSHCLKQSSRSTSRKQPTTSHHGQRRRPQQQHTTRGGTTTMHGQEVGEGGGQRKHEGGGEHRMRGKRYKAAVQTIFEIKGMSKPKGKTWREVGWWVNLSEEDEEQAWEAAIQEAREQATRQQRRGTGATPHDPQQHARDMARFSQLLNKHLEPHTPATAAAQGEQSNQARHANPANNLWQAAAAGGLPTKAKETASSRQHGDPRCRRGCSQSGGPLQSLQRMAPQSGTRTQSSDDAPRTPDWPR